MPILPFLALTVALSASGLECNSAVVLPEPTGTETEFLGKLCGTDYGEAFLDTVQIELSLDQRH